MRTFWQIVSLEARTRLSYRAEFWVNATVAFVTEFGVLYFLWSAMFRESGSETIGGRTLNATILYFMFVVLLGKLVRGNRMHGQISSDIYEGSLNRYLVFPYPYFRFKFAQRMGQMMPDVLKAVMFGFVAAFWIDVSAWEPSVAGISMALAAVLGASLVYFLILASVHQVAFWADNVWSLDVAVWFVTSLLGGWMVPLSVFPQGVQDAIRFLPFRYLFDFPVRVILGEIGALEWAQGMAVVGAWCIAFTMLNRWIWKRGALRYSGLGI